MSSSQKHQRRIHTTRQKRERQRKKSQHVKKLRHRQHQEQRNLLFRLYKTITHYFPDLFDRMRQIPDCRQAPAYTLVEILAAGLFMQVFKKGSRNAMNNDRNEPRFRKNYARVLKVRLPHMDTVDDVLAVLDATHLEALKVELIKALLAKKLFRKYRIGGQYYLIAIDATEVMTVQAGHCDRCLHQRLKNGTVRYFHAVLEAKLVCRNGFCLSVGTVWIENQAEYEKQDCELKAFRRLAPKLKQAFPRLPMCLVADGLYPNQTFFGLCRHYGWQWIVTFKTGNLPSVWRQILDRQGRYRCVSRRVDVQVKGQAIRRTYHWYSDLSYQDFTIQWFTCTELVDHRVTEFTYLSSLAVNYQDVVELTAAGRMRWKIENEGFNIQKQHGYHLGHQYSRTSMLAMKNYYQLMQIAHLINQLFELSGMLQALMRSHESLTHLWDMIMSELRAVLDMALLATIVGRRMQFRYD